MQIVEHEIQFFTATILKWKYLLLPKKHKEIIVSSLDYLARNNRIKVFAFVIMPNHIHLVWLVNEKFKRQDVQRDFLKFTAQQLKFSLIDSDEKSLSKHKVDAKDRMFQIWQRNSLSVDLFNQKMVEQKIEYIHNNPIQEHWNLATDPSEYYYSSAAFYEQNKSNFNFLTDYRDFV